MTTQQYTSIAEIKNRIDILNNELIFIQRPETLRYPITELSYRENDTFDYNVYSTEIISLIYNLLTNEKTILESQFNQIYVSGSL